MATQEIVPQELDRSVRRGLTKSAGQRTWLCDYRDRNGPWAPAVGVSRFTDGLRWPPCWEDSLVCTDLSYEYEGPEQPGQPVQNRDYTTCKVTATYESIDALINDYEIESSSSVEVITTGIGRTWFSDGQATDQQLALPIRQEIIRVRKAFLFNSLQLDRLRAAKDAVNAGAFFSPWGETFGPECLRLRDWDRKRVPDPQNGVVRNVITMEFLAAAVSHNIVWREPLQQRDASGALMWDAATSAPVYVGTGGWDRMVPDLFGVYNFADLFAFP